MLPAPELHRLSPSLYVWQRYEPAAKVDLFSSAVSAPSGLFLIDPSGIAPSALKQVFPGVVLAGLIVTNDNHWRDAPALAKELSIPLFAHPDCERAVKITPVENGSSIDSSFNVISIEGAVAGEIALHLPGDGILILGDALINLDPYGFTFLPEKYCLNGKQMRASLQTLLHVEVSQILFAHGTPIVARARERLRALLQSGV